MSNYDFSTLNDKDLEKLSRDLLNAKSYLNLQSFKSGRDKGIDLRFSTSKNDNSIIVQVKHYIGSKYSKLKSVLEKEELSKIIQLKPDRYILVTSLPLSAAQKSELKKLLAPFVLTSNDIIGQEDLNQYLQEFPKIEKRNFKLWFSSTAVIESILNTAIEEQLNNAITGRTRYLLKTIKSKIAYYVVTNKLNDARRVLEKEKVLLITGQPGVGKTTLAEIILFERARKGAKVFKVENIREAEDLLRETDEKQIFYFDDFLGSNYLEIVSPSKTEGQIISFIDRIRNTKNKYLVLTTRTVILNHAIEKFESIDRSRLATDQFEIKLTDYTPYEKALMLYNHLFFKNVRDELFEAILFKKFYRTIVGHENFTPRLIEFFTDNSKVGGFSPDEYREFIQTNLDNPKEIWRHSFNNQIDFPERWLLATLFTFKGVVAEERLSQAFNWRLEYEKRTHNHIIRSEQFIRSVGILLNGFIKAEVNDVKNPVRHYSFINPSLVDFLMGLVKESVSEKRSIIESSFYLEQLTKFDFSNSYISLEREIQHVILEKFEKSEIILGNTDVNSTQANWKIWKKLEALWKYCGDENIDSLALLFLEEIDFNSQVWIDLDFLEYFALNSDNLENSVRFIKNNFIRLIESQIKFITDKDQAESVPVLFGLFDQDYDKYLRTSVGNEVIRDLFERVSETIKEEEVFDQSSYVHTFFDAEELISTYNNLAEDLNDALGLMEDFEMGLDKFYWEKKIEKNDRSDREALTRIGDQKNLTENPSEDIETKIDDLFIKPN